MFVCTGICLIRCAFGINNVCLEDSGGHHCYKYFFMIFSVCFATPLRSSIQPVPLKFVNFLNYRFGTPVANTFPKIFKENDALQ